MVAVSRVAVVIPARPPVGITAVVVPALTALMAPATTGTALNTTAITAFPEAAPSIRAIRLAPDSEVSRAIVAIVAVGPIAVEADKRGGNGDIL